MPSHAPPGAFLVVHGADSTPLEPRSPGPKWQFNPNGLSVQHVVAEMQSPRAPLEFDENGGVTVTASQRDSKHGLPYSPIFRVSAGRDWPAPGPKGKKSSRKAAKGGSLAQHRPSQEHIATLRSGNLVSRLWMGCACNVGRKGKTQIL